MAMCCQDVSLTMVKVLSQVDVCVCCDRGQGKKSGFLIGYFSKGMLGHYHIQVLSKFCINTIIVLSALCTNAVNIM